MISGQKYHKNRSEKFVRMGGPEQCTVEKLEEWKRRAPRMIIAGHATYLGFRHGDIDRNMSWSAI